MIKIIIKYVIGISFLPFLILGGMIAVVRVLFIATFGLAWQKGDDWYSYMFMKLNDFIQWLK
jgi:hypothetical protein